ncbi:uncharacterized protein LOC111402870 [Olea europaea var. sylvestris]|uniref:uncharacterized protein LOC111402870 n=1 Tax=Olea europaea var. sylvestris TaxID=158386 RepID=UPI000C1D1013|nr:uncharacterized protein LOC111402870 [Olea europaea var. sylvestris]
MCYDVDANKIRISRNVVFFDNQYFFQSLVFHDSASIQLPEFDDMSNTVECFKPGFVYQRRPPLPPSDIEPSLDLIITEPQRSSRVSCPTDKYGFSHIANQATLDTTFVLKSYSQASIHACRKAMQEELQALQNNHT